MATCRISAFVKACPMRVIYCLLCFASAALVCAVVSYPLLLSSSSMVSLASIFPELLSLRSTCTTSSSMISDRGLGLFHNWPDEELFDRAISAEMMQIAPMLKDLERERADSGLRVYGLLTQQNLLLSGSSSVSSQRNEVSACQAPRGQMRTSKIAFLFLTRGPLPFLPLWGRFFHGHEDLYNIYVHLDPFRVGIFDRKSAGVFWGRLIPPGLTERGAPSLAAATRRLLANAMLDDPLNQYFVVVSERCIPLVSFRNMYDHVMASEKSFIEILKEAPTLAQRYASRGAEVAMLPEVPFSRFRVGSQFFVLKRKHTAMVVSDKKIWSKFSAPCVDASICFVEEHYFPTLIDMEDGECATGFTVTNVDWSVKSAESGHPRTYGQQEMTRELIVSLRQNGTFLFARKFTDECLEPLLQLAAFMFDDKNEQEAAERG